jgi:nicotinamide-nucleotide amidase
MIAEIITIGDEILIGQVVDTNSAWIAESLNSVGISVGQITSISDSAGQIKQTLDEAAKRAQLILITGGLGPTRDDITKKTLAEYFGSRLVLNKEALSSIEKLLVPRGVQMNVLNMSQAFLPDNCQLIPNRYGTAMGMWFTRGDRHFISMPGVPHEMKGMMTESVLGLLRDKFSLPEIEHRTILTQGIPESHLALKLEQFEDQLPDNIKLAYLPSPGMVRLRLTAKVENKQEAGDLLEKEAKKLIKIIPEAVFGREGQKLEVILGELLLRENATLATAESCTGGTIAQMIVSVPGASRYFKGTIVAYSNELKVSLLNIDKEIIDTHGAVSEQIVRVMAENIRKICRADYAIATSGIAGPDGGTEEKPIGTTWIAVASAVRTVSDLFHFGDNRDRNIQKASVTALNMMRKFLVAEN